MNNKNENRTGIEYASLPTTSLTLLVEHIVFQCDRLALDELLSRRPLFRRGPFQEGTNNVGEFLAIVDALMILEKKKCRLAVYSDSATAIGWVKAKHCNTGLAAVEKNARLFELIDRAEVWLEGQTIRNPILKWDTKAWGEIPADFNRK